MWETFQSIFNFLCTIGFIAVWLSLRDKENRIQELETKISNQLHRK